LGYNIGGRMESTNGREEILIGRKIYDPMGISDHDP
jgi:hypothetical protein